MSLEDVAIQVEIAYTENSVSDTVKRSEQPKFFDLIVAQIEHFYIDGRLKQCIDNQRET